MFRGPDDGEIQCWEELRPAALGTVSRRQPEAPGRGRHCDFTLFAIHMALSSTTIYLVTINIKYKPHKGHLSPMHHREALLTASLLACQTVWSSPCTPPRTNTYCFVFTGKASNTDTNLSAKYFNKANGREKQLQII